MQYGRRISKNNTAADFVADHPTVKGLTCEMGYGKGNPALSHTRARPSIKSPPCE